MRRLLTVALVATAAATFLAGTAYADAPKALVDASSLGSTGSSSEEVQLAESAGYNVTIVPDSTWASMSASDFAQYNVLIVGDPTCGAVPGGVLSSAGVWGPVVLGEAGGRTYAGNRIVIGTDPAFHSGENPGSSRAVVVKDGIAFAGRQPDTTGMYFDASCGGYYSPGGITTALAAMSTGSGSWSIDTRPPCGGNVSLIASNPAFSDLTTADLEGWGCSVHESFPTFPSDWNALAVATDTASHPTCGVDPNTGVSACGEAYVLVAGSGIVVKSGSISLAPADSTDPTGGTHTVTATVTSGGSPLVGQTITFTVTGQNAGATGTCAPVGCVTDASGNVSFTYGDTNGAGDDTIKGSFTDARGSLQAATAAEHWKGDQPITATGTTISAGEGTSFSGAVATFSDPDTTATAAEYTATIAWGDGNTSPGTITGGGGTFTVSGDHTYADEGSNTVTVTIDDVDTPANTATATSPATVADAALTTGSLSLGGATEGAGATTASYTFTDGNTTATASDFSATITWGDGITSAGTVAGGSGSFTVDGSHTYGDEGSYPVSVSVSDDGGSTAGGSGTALVADAALTATGVDVNSGQSFTGNVASFTDGNASAAVADFAATINWGDGSSSTGTVSASGSSYSVAGSHTYTATGYDTVTVTIADDGGSTATATSTLLIYAGAPGGGSFVIGNKEAANGTAVTFWGAQWWKLNAMTGGSGPAGFKGFEGSGTAVCGTGWTARTGNSTPPPAGPLPAYMAVVVASSASQSGSTVSGDAVHVVIVRTNAGYGPDPSQPGTGTVVATIC